MERIGIFMNKNWSKIIDEYQEEEAKRKIESEKREKNMSLDEKISKMTRIFNEKMADRSLYFVSKSEKNRMKRLSKKQKHKRRRRLLRLGLLYDDDGPEEEL